MTAPTPDAIRIVGARHNNLRHVSLEVPRRAITAFVGRSGSGKSSLVFDTIAAEAQRQVNDTYAAFVRNRMPHYGTPEVDHIENLSPVVVIDQRRLGGNARSTVGTITDIGPLLRLLFSRHARPWVGESNHFSFNDPAGMCPSCQGLGVTTAIRVDELLDRTRSLNEGAIRHPAFAVDRWYRKYYATSGLFDADKALGDYSEAEWAALLHGDASLGVVEPPSAGGPVPSDHEGVLDRFDRLFVRKERAGVSPTARDLLDRFTTSATCPTCQGDRLKAESLAARIGPHSIADLGAMEVADLVDVIAAIDDPAVASVTEALTQRLGALVEIGLGYLHLSRATTSLSGGESQRIKMVRHLGSSLVELLYIFDEPSVGLHAADVARLNRLLRRLADKGNTVLVVEHAADVIEIADHVVELGPGAGAAGGGLVFEGTVAELRKAPTITGRMLAAPRRLRPVVRRRTGQLDVVDVRQHNLAGLTTAVPTGVLTVITGVAGSGKSTLVHHGLCAQHPDVVVIDQSAVRANRRSSPATYTGIMDEIRHRFAAATGQPAALFSANSQGACPDCEGLGVIWTDLAFMDRVVTTCSSCHGRRFTDEVLAHRLDGRSIADVLEMTVAEAAAFFAGQPAGAGQRTRGRGRGRKGTAPIDATLATLMDVGLGYLRLGQPMDTLSGGESQRIKLADELAARAPGAAGSGGRPRTYALDEPTTGLHPADVAELLRILDRLVDGGATVLVIEHDLDVITHADWILELGPGAGGDGGQLVFAGTPDDLLEHPVSPTASHLRRHLARGYLGVGGAA